MKTLLLSAAAAIALAGSASAMTASTALESELRNYGADVNVENLTQEQIDVLKMVIHSGNSASETRAAVWSILNG